MSPVRTLTMGPVRATTFTTPSVVVFVGSCLTGESLPEPFEQLAATSISSIARALVMYLCISCW